MVRICPTPTDNFPFTAETFALIGRIAPDIKRFSARYNVYPIAVAGAIADEYNTRTDYRAILDWLQDDIVINWLPDWFISSNARINIRVVPFDNLLIFRIFLSSICQLRRQRTGLLRKLIDS